MINRTEREKLKLAAKAAGITVYDAFDEWVAMVRDGESIYWDPRWDSDQAAELMIAIKGYGLCGDTVQEWRERVFEAAVYQGSLM